MNIIAGEMDRSGEGVPTATVSKRSALEYRFGVSYPSILEIDFSTRRLSRKRLWQIVGFDYVHII